MIGENDMGAFIAGCFIGSFVAVSIICLLKSNHISEDYYTEDKNV